MHRPHRWIPAALLAAAAASGTAQTPRDAVTLFRMEVPNAARDIRWRGERLEDDVLFALAATGLSWQARAGTSDLFEKGKRGLMYSPAAQRADALRSALGRAEKEAFALALSLVLAPDGTDDPAWPRAFQHLRQYGPGFDKALVGVLEAPKNLPLLPRLQYAAADVLVYRASGSLFPLFVALAQSDDSYLRSRAVAALGVIAFRSEGSPSPAEWGLRFAPTESSISATQRRMLREILRDAAGHRSYRVRAAAAMALGLAGSDEDVPLLTKLAKDSSYVAAALPGRDTKRVVFPVRAEAAASLLRFGRRVEVREGIFSGRELKQVLRGGRDVSRDRDGLARDRESAVTFCDKLW